MTDDPEDIALVYLRRIDEKLDRFLAELGDPKPRTALLEGNVNRTESRFAEIEASIAAQLDLCRHMEQSLARIDQRLEECERLLTVVPPN
jgi:hypothetical protein